MEGFVKLVRFHESLYGTYATTNALNYLLKCVASSLEAANHGKPTDLSASLAAIAASLSTTATRMLCPAGLLGEAEALASPPSAGGWSHPAGKPLARAQTVVMAGAYAFEHASWLASVAPKLVALDSGKMLQWSCHCWLAWVVLGTASMWLRIKELQGIAARVAATHHRENRSIVARKMSDLRLHLARMFLRLPPALQWSQPNSPLAVSAKSVLLLCTVDAVLGLYLMWSGRGASRPQLLDDKAE